MAKRKIFDIILSVVVAILLWAYVVNVVNPPTTATVKNVPVQLVNQEVLASSKLAISGNTNFTVDVVVAGTRADVKDVNASQLTATADLFGLSAGQNYLTVNVTCPSNLTVENVNSQRIQVVIEELVMVKKPVELIIGEVEEGYEVTMENTGSEFVQVTGAKSLVDKVAKIHAELDPSDFPLDEPTTLLLDAVPLDEEGAEVEGVKLERSYVEVKGTVYGVKTVALSVSLSGEPAYGAEIDMGNFPTKIAVKGPQAALNAVRSIPTKTIDISGMAENKAVMLVPILPEDVMLSDRAGSLKLSINLTGMGKVNYTYDVSSVSMENVAEDLEVSLNPESVGQTVSLTVSGDLADIMTVSEEDFLPFINLADISESGTYDLPVTSLYNGTLNLKFTPEVLKVDVVSTAQLDDENHEDPEGMGAGGSSAE